MVDIRTAQPSDIPALAALLAVLFAQEAEFAPDTAAQERGLAAIVGAPDVGRVLVAGDGGRVLGMVNLLYTMSTALGARVAILEDMVVSPEARGQGVGRALLDKAIETCRADGCRRITLLTDGENAPAQRFYQRAGFTRSAMVPYRRPLEET